MYIPLLVNIRPPRSSVHPRVVNLNQSGGYQRVLSRWSS